MTKKTKSKIPKKFYTAGKCPVVKNAGELKVILAELPDELPIEASFGRSVQVVVYNYKYDDCHLSIEEADEE